MRRARGLRWAHVAPSMAAVTAIITLLAACGGGADAGGGGLDEEVAAIEAFFDDFTDEWVRGNPDQAVASRYFEGEEQAALDRQMTPIDEPSEVDRYVVFAGQACSYMIGQLRIVELRERAREALGPRFSLAEFHDVVLRLGSVPLGVMESEVERWIERTRG